MKKFLSLMLALVMSASLFTACSTSDAGTETETTNFTLTYPESMTAQGYEPLVLDEVPSRIACTSTSPVLTLDAMGASLIAIPSSTATKHIVDANPDMAILKSLMSDEFNIEDVVALNPDLVILSASYKDSHGATLESLGINVYYQAAGHGVSYETVKEESMCLIDAFAIDEESNAKAETLKQSFADIEDKCETLAAANEGKKIMVLQAGGPTQVYGQTSGGTLGSMLNMLGFENVSDSTAAASMFAIDYETALVDQPEMLVVVGSGEAADTKTLMGQIIDSNPAYWNAMTAVAEENIMYLGREYIAVYGIGYVSALETLATEVETFYAE